ncbi:hypothetical protein TWF281_001463 [Arthrobotrys megalospora]
MSLFSSLPSEILIQILGDDGLSNADAARLRRVCRLFNDHAFYRKIVFNVDAVSHSPWKFARQMLFYDAELCKKCFSFVVRWDWNIVRRWTPVESWEWTEVEKTRIVGICEQWVFGEESGVRGNILKGRNSEALLPLLLCYTPNLRSLNLGDSRG